MRARGAVLAAVLLTALLMAPAPAGAFSAHQRSALRRIARDTWRFYAADLYLSTEPMPIR